MIALLRIDERLIHGQVATSWSKALDIDTIVCASDEAAQNPLKKKMLLIAAPPGKKTHVRSVDEVIGLLQDPRAERMKIFLLTDNPKDALKLVSALGLKNWVITTTARQNIPQAFLCMCSWIGTILVH